jgi:plasmid maintenance system killer protein
MAPNESGAPSPAGANATAHSNRPRALIIVAVCVLLVAAIALYFYLHSRPTALVYSGTVETREIQVGSKIGGRVTSVFVEEGQRVTAGAPLASFECDAIKAQLAEAKATVEQAGADLNRLHTGNRPEEIVQADAQMKQQADALQEAKNGPRAQEILAAEADFSAAQATAADAAADYSRMKPLAEHDVISRQQFDGVTAHRNATAQQAESLRQKLALLQAGTRPEDLRQADQRYQQALAADTLMHRPCSRAGDRGQPPRSQPLRARHRGHRSRQRPPRRSRAARTDRAFHAGELAALGEGLRTRDRPQPPPPRPNRQCLHRCLPRPALHWAYSGDRL